VRPAEERYTALILNCAVYKSGGVFAIHELQRSLPSHRGFVAAGRLREVVNALIDRGQIETVTAPNGETHYRARTGSRELLSKLWARPVSSEHTPVWR
jgi:hypothetical protein